MKKATKIALLAYLDPPQKAALDALTQRTRIPRSVLLREAVDDLLKKHKQKKGGAK